MTDYVHEHFAKYPSQPVRPSIKMKNGKTISVQASAGHYCSPRKDDAEYYDTVEVWCWTTQDVPRAFKPFTDDKNHPAGWVPVDIVNQYIAKNGGAAQ